MIAERILISSALANVGAANLICTRVNPDMVKDRINNEIFKAIYDCVKNNIKPSLANVASNGIPIPVLKDIVQEGAYSGEIGYILENFFEHYRIEVEKQFNLDLSVALSTERYDTLDSIHDKRTKLLNETYHVQEDPQAKYEQWINDLISRHNDYLKGIIKIPGIATGFKELDKMTGGHMPGELIVVGASPGTGKTSLGLHFCRSAGKSCLVSVEMPYKSIFTRLVSSATGINSMSIRDGRLSAVEIGVISKEAEKIKAGDIHIVDDVSHINQITGVIRDIHARMGINLFIVDYLQLITGNGRDRRTEVGGITKELMLLAKSAGITIILLSQLARSLSRPSMKDLKESGDIEAHAHKIFLLWPDADSGMIDIMIVKNREGMVGNLHAYVNFGTGIWSEKDGVLNEIEPALVDYVPF